MKRVYGCLVIAGAMVACVIAAMPFTAGRADDKGSSIRDVTLPLEEAVGVSRPVPTRSKPRRVSGHSRKRPGGEVIYVP
jgi:hypothetical protein